MKEPEKPIPSPDNRPAPAGRIAGAKLIKGQDATAPNKNSYGYLLGVKLCFLGLYSFVGNVVVVGHELV